MTKKPRYAYFQMPEFMRRSIINAHVFYVEQARKLLLKLFFVKCARYGYN